MTTAILLALVISAQSESRLDIDVVYPRQAHLDTIARIDHVSYNFVFGSVTPPYAALRINGTAVPVEKSGAFLAFLPVDWNSQIYRFEVEIDSLTAIEKILPFIDRATIITEEQPDKNDEFPIELTLSGGVARSHPDGVYYLFPLPGTRVEAVSGDKGYFKVPLSPARSVWISKDHVKSSTPSLPSSKPIVWKAEVLETQYGDELVIPLDSKLLFRILPTVNARVITLEIYGVITHIDIISYRNPTRLIRQVVWEVPADNVLRLEVNLSEKLWGYKIRFEENSLRLLVRKPPKIRRGVRGLTIAVDPGHGGDSDGSIGPLRLTEKEVNLKAALKLGEILESKGASVILSRNSDVEVGLLERIKMAEEAEADLLISLHHNALADGIDPFSNFGTGTHYYHPLSRGLAEAIQSSVHRELSLYHEGVYYNNLAIVRPTYMPAVLLEAAYMMIPEHEELMMQPKYPERLARAVYKGIKSYLEAERKLVRTRKSSHRLNYYSGENYDE